MTDTPEALVKAIKRKTRRINTPVGYLVDESESAAAQ
jgi:hypothetical protein